MKGCCFSFVGVLAGLGFCGWVFLKIDPAAFGAYVFALVAAAFYILGLLIFARNAKRKWLDQVKVTPIRSVPRGYVQVEGEVEPYQKTFHAPFSNKECVWYSVQVEYDPPSSNRSRFTVYYAEEQAPFYVKDKTGRILVAENGSFVHPIRNTADRVAWEDLPKDIQSQELASNKKPHYSYREAYLPVGVQVRVSGNATDKPPEYRNGEQSAVSSTVLGWKNRDQLRIKRLTGDAHYSPGYGASIILIVSSTAFFPASLWYFLVNTHISASPMQLMILYWSTFAVFAAFAGLVMLVIMYNTMVASREHTIKTWSDIDVLLRQRYDELPNLVETVKGYTKHEGDVLQRVTEARAHYEEARNIHQALVAEEILAGAIPTLLGLAEEYPDLKADKHFIHLQKRISELEHEIADRREQYNAAVQLYNTIIQKIPYVFLAKVEGFTAAEFYQA